VSSRKIKRSWSKVLIGNIIENFEVFELILKGTTESCGNDCFCSQLPAHFLIKWSQISKILNMGFFGDEPN
jgi:hypothetical protein